MFDHFSTLYMKELKRQLTKTREIFLSIFSTYLPSSRLTSRIHMGRQDACMLYRLFRLDSSSCCQRLHYSDLATSYPHGSHHKASYVVDTLVVCLMHGSLLSHGLLSILIRCPWKLSRLQRRMSLIELRARCSRKSVVGMRSFKDTPQIRLIIPMSAVTNRLTSSVTIGQVLLP